MFKYRADLKSVLYMVLIMSCFIFLWNNGLELWQVSAVSFIVCYILYLYFSIAISVIIHNHTHLNIWKNKILNRVTDCWLTLFYGYPVFAWYPTHHQNHHVYVNKAEDATKTYMKSEKNNLLTLLTYPTLSGGAQQPPIGKYIKKNFNENRAKFWFCLLQIFCLATWLLAFLLLSWKKALLFVVIPQQVSLNTVLIFNYLQHVHADEEDDYNSSRNFTSRLTNFMLFNNGLHTVHHLKPALHWSKLPGKHAEIEHKIDPELNRGTIWGFLIKTYIVGIFIPKYRTKSMRLDRMNNLI